MCEEKLECDYSSERERGRERFSVIEREILGLIVWGWRYLTEQVASHLSKKLANLY